MTLLEKLNELVANGATAEDIQSSLGQFMIPKGEFNKVNDENKTLKTQVSVLEGNVSELNTQMEVAKTSTMNEQELLLHKLQQAEGLIKSHTTQTNRVKAENSFITAGFSEEEYKDLLEQVVSDDSSKTQSLVDGFIKLSGNRAKQATDDKVNSLLAKNNELPKGDKLNPSTDISLDAFKAMTLTERSQMLNDNPDAYNTLNTSAKAQ